MCQSWHIMICNVNQLKMADIYVSLMAECYMCHYYWQNYALAHKHTCMRIRVADRTLHTQKHNEPRAADTSGKFIHTSDMG